MKVYENHGSIAFMDIRPTNPGHVLIVSKKHFKDLLEADDETLAAVAIACKKIAHAAKKAVGADGVNLVANNGEAAGQLIFHLHWHIIPRFKDDGLKCWPHKEISQEEISRIAEDIKKEI